MEKLPTWVEVDLDRLIKNIRTIRALLGDGVKILLTVKADAYGHGAVQVVQASSGLVDLFGVATLDEATELNDAGFGDRVLILSPVLETELPAVAKAGYRFTVSSLEFARRVSAFAAARGVSPKVHVEVDTGMGRTGVVSALAEAAIRAIARLPNVAIEGVYTHFPVSDSDAAFTRGQVDELEQLVERLRSGGVEIPLVHSANSAAVAAIAESHLDMVRPGLLAYGHLPSGMAGIEGIEPVLSWKSRIARIRRLDKGASISYGRTFVAARPSVIGVVPVGYGHGYPFRASRGGRVLVGGQRVPIVGRVTMDMTMVDLTDLPTPPRAGDEVVLIGRQEGPFGTSSITIHDLAGWAGTIGYEVICGLSKRVPRTYFRKGKVETYKSLLGILPNHVTV